MRLQLALNVSDLDAAVSFYEDLFGVEAAKRKPGYANFAIAQPPLKLVLFEGPEDGTINHLGVEVETADEVAIAHERLVAAGLDATSVVETQCCHADKVETWVTGPDATRWEWYVKTADVEDSSDAVVEESSDDAVAGTSCCVDVADDVDREQVAPSGTVAGAMLPVGSTTVAPLPVTAAAADAGQVAQACCAS
ncbi:MAG TPA: ArsI/CadI family heavy metal resistance metalloenzyme [Nitriliruptoraceae bacterium]|nr:ArsI/CadI family heavy metal resistance metalloenzyme [Nitriliruptoraceae bacterium]